MSFRGNKTRWAPSVGVPSSTLIHGHALCLSGRRPSSAVHHFGIPIAETTYAFTIAHGNQSREIRVAALECAQQDLLAASHVGLSASRCHVSDDLNLMA